jgi:Zn-dependent protease with chaperone function
MKKRIDLILTLFVVPVVAFWLAHRSHLAINSKWYPAVRMTQGSAVLAVVLGAFLVIAIIVMANVARGNRNRMVLVFKPGLYVILVGLLVLSLLHTALLLAATIFALQQFAIILAASFYVIFFIMGVGFGGILCVIALIRASLVMFRTSPTIVVGRSVSDQRAPFLWKYVKDLARKIDALPPENIVVGLDNTFFVIDAEVKCFTGLRKGRTLYLSLPICRILNEEELRAIIGHELGHFKGDDTRFSQRFAPVYQGAFNALDLLRRMPGTLVAMSVRPAITVLSYFLNSFHSTKSEIGRERELVADSVGAELAGKQAMGSALVKVHAFDDYWDRAVLRMRDSLNEGKLVPNVSKLYADYVAENSNSFSLDGLDEQCLPHPTDTHPPLKLRLEALGCTMTELKDAALMTSPSNCAVHLIDRYEETEAELTKMDQSLMEKTGEVSRNPQIRCPVCGKLSPAAAESCSCGLRFGRSTG